MPRAAIALAAVLAALALPAAAPAGCDTHVAGAGRATQLVTVEAPRASSRLGSLRLWRKAGGCWRAVAGPWTARLGWNGVRRDRREGDGTTPAGSFPFGRTVYGTAPDPGVRLRYHRLVCGDWWNGDPASPGYNTFRHVRCGARPPFGGASEALWRQTRAYRYLAVIGFNMHPAVPGRGSAIFLHADLGHATNGCVSLPRARLVRLLRWLRPAARPRIVIRVR